MTPNVAGQFSRSLAIGPAVAQLEHTEGPSSWAATYYRGLGYLPPAWWDPGTIDDPAAEPDGLRLYGPNRRGDKQVLYDDVTAPRVERVRRMTARGLSTGEIAAAIGCRLRYVQRDLRESAAADRVAS